MKKYLLLALVILHLSCKKDGKQPNARDSYGCVYGVLKTTQQRTNIKCTHREIYQAGNNQTAANSIADRLGISREDVTVMNNYTNWEFVANKNCDCN